MKLSLAAWSVHPLMFDKQNPLALVDLPAYTRKTFGLTALEPVSGFFKSTDPAYLDELKTNADQAGVQLMNLAVDAPGDLSSDDPAERDKGVAANVAWVAAAEQLGIAAMRCNTGGKQAADREAALGRCVESFQAICDEGQKRGVTILVENHWGLSDDPALIVRLVKAVRESHGDAAIGTLPDFGNWHPETDRYAAVATVMPYAGAVHAKAMALDAELNHPAYDLARCVKIAQDAGYDGPLGIEYEGGGDCVQGVQRAAEKLGMLL